MSHATSHTEEKKRINRTALVAQVLYNHRPLKMTAAEVAAKIEADGVAIGMHYTQTALSVLSGHHKYHKGRNVLKRNRRRGNAYHAFEYYWNPNGTYDCRPAALGNVKVDNIRAAVLIDRTLTRG